jgi:hypothetical protein
LQGFHLRHRKAGMSNGNGDIGDPGGLRRGRDLGARSLVVGLVLRTVVDDQRHAQGLGRGHVGNGDLRAGQELAVDLAELGHGKTLLWEGWG